MSDQLRHLAEAYFHQDYELEFAQPDIAIGAFADGEGSRAVRRLISEIDELLGEASLNETSLAELWTKEFGASYVPVADGLTYRSWLEHVRKVLLSSTPTRTAS